MKSIHICCLITSIIFCFQSCKKEETPDIDADYFVFGKFYGECFNEDCVNIFVLQDGKLYEDTSDQYPSGEITPDTSDHVLLSDADRVIAEDIFAAIPAELYTDTINVYGCPDCYDQGGLVIQVKENSVVHYYRIDNDTSALPTWLRDFTVMMLNKVSLL